MKLQVLQGRKESDRYFDALIRAVRDKMDRFMQNDTDVIKQVVYYGVRCVTAHKRVKHLDNLSEKYQFIEMLRVFMRQLTPYDFLTIFPITKEYDGDRLGMKDYFFTAKRLKNYDMDQPLGDRLDDFLWDYYNRQLIEFDVERFCVASDIIRLETGRDIGKEWADKMGITTYTEDKKARTMTNNTTGEVIPFKRKLPKHLKLI